jgi:copper chaperone CopZ
METINLSIPSMKNAHCQMTVANAVTEIGGKVKSIAPTKVEIELHDLSRASVVQAIEKAGYNVIG